MFFYVIRISEVESLKTLHSVDGIEASDHANMAGECKKEFSYVPYPSGHNQWSNCL